MTDLDRITRVLRDAAEKATPGPWCRFYRGNTISVMKGSEPKLNRLNKEIIAWSGFDGTAYSEAQNARNAALIVLLRNHIIPILDALDAAIARVRELEAER